MKQNISDEAPLILKPKFLKLVVFLKAIPGAVFLGIFGGVFVTVVVSLAAGQAPFGPTSDPTTTAMLFVGGAIVFIILLESLTIWYRKTALSHIEYRIFPNRIEYFEGFFTVEQKTIKFVDVTEIYLRKGVFQKRNNLGSIFLMSRGMMVPMIGMMKGGLPGAMILRDIENPDAIYQQLKQLKDEAQA
ncbi:MAG: PH domain-containing protein [Candidatus Hodarchaeales archaeon]|jgi:hypothetical protein